MTEQLKHAPKKYHAFDMCKWFLAMIIIFVHTGAHNNFRSNKLQWNIFMGIADCTVPIFFAISGYLMFKKMGMDYSSADSMSRIKKGGIKMLKLYIIWTAVYLPISVFGYIKTDYNLMESVVYFLRGFLLRGANFYSWQLWYLLYSAVALFLIYIMLKFRRSFKAICIFAYILMLLSDIISYLVSIRDKLPPILETPVRIYYAGFGKSGAFFTGMAFICVGIMITRKKEDYSQKQKYINIAGTVVFWFPQAFLPEVFKNTFRLAFVWFILQVLISLKLPDSKVWRWLREASSVMYFTHTLVLCFYVLLRYRTEHFGWDSFIAVMIGTHIISVFLIASEKSKTVKWLKVLLFS